MFLYVLFLSIAWVSTAPVAEDEADNYRTSIDLSYLGEKIFGNPSNETGKRLETWNENSEINPEEMGEYAEGDILFPNEGRNGLLGEAFRWKDGVIPYEISPFYSPNDVATIKRAMDIYHKYTCISFRPKTSSDKDYISIVNGPTGCWSSVGRIGGRQEINLQSPYCTTKVGTAMHELMHAVGFLHEQNRAERDDFVDIVWGNIKKGHENNFNKADKDKTGGFGVGYDYRSVMHYSKTAFSVNGQPTILPKDNGKSAKMGQRDGFSKGDITKINNMYNCQNKGIGSAAPTETHQSGNQHGGLLSFLFS